MNKGAFQLPSNYENMTSDYRATFRIRMTNAKTGKSRKDNITITGSKCGVCDIKFNTFKDLLEHVITNAHLRNMFLQDRLENVPLHKKTQWFSVNVKVSYSWY
jgi:hypothetical protein